MGRPFRRGGDAPARRGDEGDLQVRATGVGHRPNDQLPDARPMPLGGSPPRDRCWPQIPEKVRDRVNALAGDRIDWWASLPAPTGDRWDHLYHRPTAVVIGTEGVVFAEPRITGDQRPVYSVTRHRLAPASYRHAEVIFTPKPEMRDGGPAPGSSSPWPQPVVPAVVPAVPGLGHAALELIGNLPPRARDLLLAPFDDTHPVSVCDWYYEGRAARFPVFVVVLVGRRQMTMAHGSRVVPVGHTDRTSHWSLVCRRADLLPKTVSKTASKPDG